MGMTGEGEEQKEPGKVSGAALGSWGRLKLAQTIGPITVVLAVTRSSLSSLSLNLYLQSSPFTNISTKPWAWDLRDLRPFTLPNYRHGCLRRRLGAKASSLAPSAYPLQLPSAYKGRSRAIHRPPFHLTVPYRPFIFWAF